VVVVQDEIKCITRRTNNDTMDDCALRRQNMFQDTRGTIRSRKSKDRKYNCQNKNRQKDKHRSTKHHTGNKRLSDANLTEKKESYSWKCCSANYLLCARIHSVYLDHNPVLSSICMTYHIGVVTRATRRMPLMEYELRTLPEHPRSRGLF
jgi:hypothetical protein